MEHPGADPAWRTQAVDRRYPRSHHTRHRLRIPRHSPTQAVAARLSSVSGAGFGPRRRTEEQTINESWNFLLMEAMQYIDEQGDTVSLASQIKPLNVLVVDDSKMFTKALVKLFDEELGARIAGKAENVEDALKFLEREDPDLVTLDVNLSVESGTMPLKHIMIRAPVPVVLMSSFDEKNFPTMMEYLCLGAMDLVEKPNDAVVGRWAANASCVAISPNYIITTRHQGGGIGTTVVFDGVNYVVREIWNAAGVEGAADLRICRIETPAGEPADLAYHTPPYSMTNEIQLPMVLGGYGDSRGTELISKGTVYGYAWDTTAGNTIQRWCSNRIAARCRTNWRRLVPCATTPASRSA